jgi:hypothetical protein
LEVFPFCSPDFHFTRWQLELGSIPELTSIGSGGRKSGISPRRDIAGHQRFFGLTMSCRVSWFVPFPTVMMFKIKSTPPGARRLKP